jgi:hypothetical protein
MSARIERAVRLARTTPTQRLSVQVREKSKTRELYLVGERKERRGQIPDPSAIQVYAASLSRVILASRRIGVSNPSVKQL